MINYEIAGFTSQGVVGGLILLVCTHVGQFSLMVLSQNITVIAALALI